MIRLTAFCLVLTFSLAASDAKEPLQRAHAHNDYLHHRPLLDALDHRFCSVEADIFLVDGELLVAHTLPEIRPKRTLESLYLKPLQQRVMANDGRVYRDGPTFTLMIDIKSDAGMTYAVLRETLAKYETILSTVEDGKLEEKAVTVILSGNRPFQQIQNETKRYCGIDGRLSDLETSMPSHLMPLISDRWPSHFSWRGNGPISEAERVKLQQIVSAAHDAGRRVRFWATPESETLWEEFVALDVDLINTDDLPRLQQYLDGVNHARESPSTSESQE